jgi:hypothetical protein
LAQDYRGTTEVSIGKIPGLLRLGIIVDFDSDYSRVQVYLGAFKEYNAIKQDYNNIISAQLPVNYFAVGTNPPKLAFVGGYPESGTPVIVGQAEAGTWYILGVLAKDPAALNLLGPKVPDIEQGSYVIQYDDTFFKINQSDGIVIGEHGNSLTLDTRRDVLSNTFDNNYSFTEASRTIEGIVRRDTFPNERYASSLRETSLDYNDTLKIIGLDPIAKENWSNVGSSIRNPARTEKRETIYEFGRSFNVLSNEQEFLSYKDGQNINVGDIVNRRESRADALSLSLVSPNHLMETIKGTVVDIYGNILDINRSVIPLGQIEKLSIKKIKTNLQEQDPLGNVFENIKKLERREIAYHFEINAKKDTVGAPDISDKSDFARIRSRFFIDIDKEGTFKVNVPASSETGNVHLLTRYENYSTVNPNDKTKDPNDLVFNQNSRDILIESFIGDNGVVEIIDELNGNAAPIDRFSTENSPLYIKHGTAYHNISNTCYTFQNNSIVYERIATTNLATGRVVNKTDVVSKKLKISGDNANGGGRSGSINFDGSIEINIGANTVDRHSLWLDLQGAMIANVGRDLRNNISAALQFDGEVLIQSGGSTPDNDSRFPNITVNNGNKPGVIDLRVITQSGKVNVIRIDNEGVSIHSESRIVMYSNGDMMFRSTGTINIDGERVLINNRIVRREVGLGSI